jgi:hypothetical protein
MTDQFPPPGWFLRPENWPYGPLLGNTFTPPQPPVDPRNQIDAQWWQQAAGANDGPATPQPNDAWDRTTPAWLRSAMPPLSNRGILGSFPQPNDLSDQGASASSLSDTPPATGAGILAQFDRWNDPQTSSTGRGILAPLERLSNPSNQTTPAWLQSATPFGPLPFAGSDGAQRAFASPFAQSYPFAQSWPQPPAEQTNAAEAAPPATAAADIPDQLDTSSANAFTRRDRRRLPMQPVPEGAAQDTLKSVGVGVGEKLIGLAGLPGLVQEGARWLGEKIADKLPERKVNDQARLEAAFNAPFAPGALTQAREDAYNNTLRSMGIPRLPTRTDIKGAIETITGPFYRPRTPDGEFAQKLTGHTLDAAGPGGVVRKAAQAVIPELTSYITEKLTKGTDSESWAPAALATAASVLAGGRPRGTPSRIPPVPSAPTFAYARPLTPLEEIQRMRYNHALNTIREAEPANPQLSALDTARWFPQSWDIHALNEEVPKVKLRAQQNPDMYSREAQRALAALDTHHLLADALKEKFLETRLYPEDYHMYLDAGWHRLLHAGPDSWVPQQKRLFETGKPPTPEDQEKVMKLLLTMMQQARGIGR